MQFYLLKNSEKKLQIVGVFNPSNEKHSTIATTTFTETKNKDSFYTKREMAKNVASGSINKSMKMFSKR